MATKKETYSQAIERLEEIVALINSGELEVDALSEKIREANELISFCNKKLTQTAGEVEKLLEEKQQTE
ncbi:exodeoxyribonuclease VII small subunit [Bacteroides sp. 214]|uniref:exodeoxyribonuclease VII small subunit n=1 Tax=Bacteroides sp. 214 TaxID=2302935 RepID=UPI0013D41AE5|nr:exodeoxyribonuclease VII small subunit [Bacteroides sp. 214]NDW13165.1 exodeoxyribonuclease VII small subunit [Bacteroides sp. 214]